MILNDTLHGTKIVAFADEQPSFSRRFGRTWKETSITINGIKYIAHHTEEGSWMYWQYKDGNWYRAKLSEIDQVADYLHRRSLD